MTKNNKKIAPEIMVVTGEVSGDIHGANLVRALQILRPDIHFSGMGGPELASVGGEILYDAEKIAVVGVVEVISRLPAIFAAQRLLRKRLKEQPPALLIIIDLPDFNLMLAKKAKALGIPVFYYITPQVWAWRTGRVKTIAAATDKLGVILPFEEEFFKKHGIAAHYVGHPLLDNIKVDKDREEFLQQHQVPRANKYIGLLPGSRTKEISALLPDFLASALSMQEKCQEKLSFLLPIAPTISMETLRAAGLDNYKHLIDLTIVENDRYNLMAACDAVVAASGTVTLELAILEIPMVVVYRTSAISCWLGKKLIKLDFFSLVNLIGGREIVSELLQEEVNSSRISLELHELLYANKGKRVREGLREVHAMLGAPGASQRAAEHVLEML